MSIKHESDTVSGTAVYCDVCGKRGPWTAYDNIEDTMRCAEMDGWTNDPENQDRDVCKDCATDKSTQQQKAPKQKLRR